jgi:RNA 2',3'-cyclic 3'-phosphodiesterase
VLEPPPKQNEGEGPKRVRLFLAVNLPSELKIRLGALQRKIESGVGQSAVRWTRSEQIHITLKFLGYISETEIPEIEATLLSTVHGQRLQLSAEGLGCFPNMRSPRVVWVGLRGNVEALASLQKQIETATAQWAEPEERDFTPHLTLGRVKEARRKDLDAISRFVNANVDKSFGEWTVEQVDLMQSVLSPDGPTYHCLCSFPLT